MCQILQFPKHISFSFASCLCACYPFSLGRLFIVFMYQFLPIKPGVNSPLIGALVYMPHDVLCVFCLKVQRHRVLPVYPQFHSLWFPLPEISFSLEADGPSSDISEGQQQPNVTSQCLRHSLHHNAYVIHYIIHLTVISSSSHFVISHDKMANYSTIRY